MGWKETLGRMFMTLIVVMISHLYTYPQSYQIINFHVISLRVSVERELLSQAFQYNFWIYRILLLVGPVWSFPEQFLLQREAGSTWQGLGYISPPCLPEGSQINLECVHAELGVAGVFRVRKRSPSYMSSPFISLLLGGVFQCAHPVPLPSVSHPLSSPFLPPT